jgi:hypothetical protein
VFTSGSHDPLVNILRKATVVSRYSRETSLVKPTTRRAAGHAGRDTGEGRRRRLSCGFSEVLLLPEARPPSPTRNQRERISGFACGVNPPTAPKREASQVLRGAESRKRRSGSKV